MNAVMWMTRYKLNAMYKTANITEINATVEIKNQNISLLCIDSTLTN